MNLYVVAGEKSGDKHGSLLLKELLNLNPGLSVQGYGGEEMHALCPAVEDWEEEAAVIGVVEVLKKYGWFKARLFGLLKRIQEEKPDCLLLIDYTGFNLRLAEKVKKTCPEVKIAYFISPQVWAWHKGRIPKIARILDLMMCIFPFEKQLFEGAGLPTEFVGHPLVDDIREIRRKNVREEHLIGLFPGSRMREIERHFPVFIQVVKSLRKTHPDWRVETSASNQKLADIMAAMATKAGLTPESFHIQIGNYHDLMDRATVAAVASGTATMEAALHELPYVLIYKVAFVTYLMARMVVKIKYLGMVNILAQRPVVRELIQNDFTPIAVMTELERLMQPNVRRDVLAQMKESVDKLGQGGAAIRAAKIVTSLMNGSFQSK
ncbi:MAG: lipid-A-disaccharide synthase [Akkermansia sp.]